MTKRVEVSERKVSRYSFLRPPCRKAERAPSRYQKVEGNDSLLVKKEHQGNKSQWYLNTPECTSSLTHAAALSFFIFIFFLDLLHLVQDSVSELVGRAVTAHIPSPHFSV